MSFKGSLKLFILIPYILCVIRNLEADDRSSARGIGMSNATLVSSFGIDAYGINPANYDYSLKEKSKTNIKGKTSLKSQWEFSVLSVGGGYGSDTTMNFYHNYLSYLSINRETFTGLFTDIASVLNFRQTVLPNEKTDVNYDFELKWLSINYVNSNIGAFNFTISDKVGLNTDVLSRDEYLPLTFYITLYPDSSYDLNNVSMHQSEAIAWWIRKYTIGYAKKFEFKKSVIKSLSLGVCGGLVNGFGNVITHPSSLDVNTYGIKKINNVTHIDSIKGYQNFNTLAALTDFFRDYQDGAESHFTFFPKPAGTGYSFDFGLTMEIGDYVKIAASVTELGKINWDYNTFINYDREYFEYYNFYLDKSDPTYNQFVNDLEGLDTRDTVSSYQTDMPTKFRAGILIKPMKNFIFEFNWMKGNNNLPSNTTKSIYSLGIEYSPLNFLPIRTGASTGGPEDFKVALGFGLRFRRFVLDFATDNINGMIMDKRFSLALSSKVIF